MNIHSIRDSPLVAGYWLAVFIFVFSCSCGSVPEGDFSLGKLVWTDAKG